MIRTNRSLPSQPALLAFLLAAAFPPGSGPAGAGERVQICPGYTFTAAPEPALEEEEIRMICGFPEAEGTADEAWTHVPRNQAVSALRAALQLRAYHRPAISEGAEGMEIDPGPRTTVAAVEARGAPPDFDVSRRRGIVGGLLTPEALDTLEGWSTETLQRLGFPCPQVSSAAGVAQRRIVVEVDAGERRAFGPGYVRGADGPLAAQIARFYAFRPDWRYERTAIDATAARLVESGLVESAQLVPVCAPGETGVVADIVPGAPRLLSLQLAANTEEYVRAQGRFLRRAPPAETLLTSEAAVLASARLQELSVSAQWYPRAAPSRSWIEPMLLLRRMDERPFELTTAQLQLAYGAAGDRPGVSWQLRAGPNIAAYRVHGGEGPDRATSLSARIEAEVSSHRYLVYRSGPQQGWSLDARGIFADDAAASDFSARYIEAGGVAHVDVLGGYPPALSLGLRARVATTFTDDADRLPPDLRHYLGGIADLRGFRRLSLPADGRGALTRAYFGVEARPDLFGPAWEPLVFVDVGALGERPARLHGSVYWSIGAGISWNSPVGPVRATLAEGRTAGDDAGLRLFLSWGETF